MDFNRYSRIFGALSSSIRLKILWVLHKQGPLSYTAMMASIGLNPIRDSSKFTYHLDTLRRFGFLETDDRRRYRLTDTGRKALALSRGLKDLTKRRRKTLVRTSRMEMEEFDRNKIVKSLVNEANVPLELAERITDEVEDRLINFQVRYLTAPLIREMVNAVLIEKGLEEYRHKLTRLGMPVYDVTKQIKKMGEARMNVGDVSRIAGRSVLEEYSLLATLPRKVADAHLGGRLHICDVPSFILQPRDFQHDIRLFLRMGLPSEAPSLTSLSPPKSLDGALSLITNLMRRSSLEVSDGCGIDYVNVFLAPFVRNLSEKEITRKVRRFILDLNQSLLTTELTLGLEPFIPQHLMNEDAVTSRGALTGKYGNYVNEAKSLFNAFVSALSPDFKGKPLLFPHFIIKIRDGFTIEPIVNILGGPTRFSNLYFMRDVNWSSPTSSYLSNGTRLSDNWSHDWRIDVLRSGSLGAIILNLPRIAYEAHGDDDRLFSLIEERCELALSALEVKHRKINDRVVEGMLPILSHKVLEDYYLKLNSLTYMVGVVGLMEAVRAHTGFKDVQRIVDFAERLLRRTSSLLKEKSERRVALFQCCDEEVAARFAFLDVKTFGKAKVLAHQKGKKPTYGSVKFFIDGLRATEIIKVEGHLQQLLEGGHLTIVPMSGENGLKEMLRFILSETEVAFFSFDHAYSYCNNCHRLMDEVAITCSICGSSSTIKYRRFSHAVKGVF